MANVTMSLERPFTDAEIRAILDEITRREFIVGAAALGALLVGCSPDEAATTQRSPSPSGGFEFVDGRGELISLPEIPEKIVMADGEAAALLPYGILPVGVIAAVPFETNPFLEGMDKSSITSLAEVFGEINLEKLAGLQPDLIISTNYDDYVGYTKDKAQQKTMETIAPILTLVGDSPTSVFLEDVRKLATALGVDLSDPELKASQQGYEDAVEALKAAVATKPGLKVLVVRGGPGTVYLVSPGGGYDVADWETWGVDVVRPGGSDRYGKEVSFERVDQYPADLIVYDHLEGQYGDPAELFAQPTFANLPAIKAGQYVDWTIESSSTYDRYKANIEKLTTAIEEADPDLVTD